MNRRQLIISVAATAGAAVAAPLATAQDLPRLTLDDPISVALGYAEDADKVDTAKFPKKAGPDAANQRCNTCALYQAVNDEEGTCSAIPGKLVAGAGWCNAWVPGAA